MIRRTWFPRPDCKRTDWQCLNGPCEFSFDWEGKRSMEDGPVSYTHLLVGYENLCYMLYDDEALLSDIFEQAGRRIVDDYRHALGKKSTSGVVVGDDWGFNTQTLLPVDVYRKSLFPWHKEIVRMAHESGRPAILHSCGKYEDVIEDIINDIGYDLSLIHIYSIPGS